MQLDLYTYVSARLQDYAGMFPWQVLQEKALDTVTVQLLLPLKTILTDAEYTAFQEKYGDASSYRLQAQFGPVVTSDANQTGYYFFTPTDGTWYKTDIDVIIDALYQLAISAVSQLRDIAHGDRAALALPWPERFERERKQQLRSVGHFEAIPVG